MSANPFLKKMGYAEDDRVVIFHADDIGMCRSMTAAFQEMIEKGPLSSGAVMVPCPWFPTVADYCRQHPEADMGVHLTLTSEWDSYRWGPISTGDPASGLMDEEGYFYRETKPAQEHATPEAVEREVIAQVERAAKAGIDITHIDTHMGTMFHAKFWETYVQLMETYQVPLMIPRFSRERLAERGLDEAAIDKALQSQQEVEEAGKPVIDQLYQMPLREPEGRIDYVKKMIDDLPPGLTHFIVHPSIETSEIAHIAPDWRGRVADYQAFVSEEISAHVAQSGISVIGYRDLREQMRAA